MKQSNDNKELTGISSLGEIVDALNKGLSSQGITSLNYYLLKQNKDECIISNVPKTLYEDFDLKKYELKELDLQRDTANLVPVLQNNINYAHHSGPEAASLFPDGKVFQLNQCFHNSKAAFIFLSQLNHHREVPLTKPVRIVFGYLSRKIPFGTCVVDKVIETSNIVLHDWHIWNYINNFIIDLSSFHHGGFYGVGEDITSWGRAEDHIFVNPPEDTEYWGVEFDNVQIFEKIFDKIIGIPATNR